MGVFARLSIQSMLKLRSAAFLAPIALAFAFAVEVNPANAALAYS
jgi:hypothetical protein